MSLIQQALARLTANAAPLNWRGLLLLQPATPEDAEADFQWPATSLVLTNRTNNKKTDNKGIPLKYYRHYLGTTQHLVILDFRDELHADALAALAGTVSGGGVLIILLPAELPTTNNTFCQRLIKQINDPLQQILVYKGTDNLTLHHPAQAQQCKPATLTPNAEQQAVIQALATHLVTHPQQPALLSAARGRGKSTTLGLLADKLLSQGVNVWLCAPSRIQAHAVFASCQQRSNMHFLAPDSILTTKLNRHDVLLIDEAASLPRHRLDEIIAFHPTVIMATTSEGYESCGRGFLLQFSRDLQANYKGFCRLYLQHPQRFSPHCPLEAWVHTCLLLKPAVQYANNSVQASSTDESAPQKHTLFYQHVHASSLPETVLEQCFYLLMDAHYQTSPNDLKLLLDDPQQTLYLQRNEENITGVAWLAEEGNLENPVAHSVVQGERRPPGNLLAQVLARHTLSPDIAKQKWVRVVRIAVEPRWQQSGLGSLLLTHIISSLYNQHYYGIGTSFASAPAINRFWRSHNFRPVRIGTKRDTISGRYALLMIFPFTPQCEENIQQWHADFTLEQKACKELLGLPDNFMPSLSSWPKVTKQQTQRYQALVKARVNAFIAGTLDFDSCKISLKTNWPEPCNTHPLLQAALSNQPLSTDLKRHYKLHGRKDLLKAVRDVCFQLTVKI